jgi:AsmA protein
VPDPSVFAPLLPRLPLASLKGLTAHADIEDHGGPVPTVSALRVNLGSVDLGKVGHGARLDGVSLTGEGGAPVKVATRVTIAGLDSAVNGTIGDIPWLMHGASGPVAVDLRWNAASGRASVKGTIQTPARFSGLALDVALDVPDPSLVAKDSPPALKSVVLRTHLTDVSEPVPFQLTSNAGDLTGELSVTRVPRLSVTGRIASSHLDLDVLRPAPPAAVPATGAAAPPAPEPPAPGQPSLGSAAIAPLIPDTKLPFNVIRSLDANVKFSFAQVLVNGADVRGIDGVLAMKDGALRVDPFTIAAPDQRLNGGLLVDASKAPPEVHLSVDAPGLALRPLLTALGLPQVATGTLKVQADLTGTGETPHAIAASLNGWAGAAIEGGRLDAQMVNSWLAQLKPLRIGGGDVTDLRCFAVRADAKSGVVAIEPLALNTAALILEGSGDVDLTHETLSLRVRPRAKIGGTGIALPLRIGGSMRAPSTKIDISANGAGGSGLAGLFLGGKDIMGEAGGGDPCPTALARARQGGQAGAAGK